MSVMKKAKYTEEDMVAFADDRTCESEREAEESALDDWNQKAKGDWGAKRDDRSWAESGIFKTVMDYIESRRKDLESGYCSPYAFSARGSLLKVLAQDFGYVFDRYEWDGRTFDSDAVDAFDLSQDGGCLEPQASLKQRVVRAFEDYLTEGAARAKAIGSDSYLAWRKALMDCVFVHQRFTSGCSAEVLESFLDDIQTAAQVTWADQQIYDQMRKVSCHQRERGKKRGEKSARR